jgi:hypothetical protein
MRPNTQSSELERNVVSQNTGFLSPLSTYPPRVRDIVHSSDLGKTQTEAESGVSHLEDQSKEPIEEPRQLQHSYPQADGIIAHAQDAYHVGDRSIHPPLPGDPREPLRNIGSDFGQIVNLWKWQSVAETTQQSITVSTGPAFLAAAPSLDDGPTEDIFTEISTEPYADSYAVENAPFMQPSDDLLLQSDSFYLLDHNFPLSTPVFETQWLADETFLQISAHSDSVTLEGSSTAPEIAIFAEGEDENLQCKEPTSPNKSTPEPETLGARTNPPPTPKKRKLKQKKSTKLICAECQKDFDTPTKLK